jgi:predicted acylesterase/phospholipase RssA
LSLLRVLDQEFTELHVSDPGIADNAPPADMLELYRRIHGLTVPRAALCLSGGGIRSASFALGVLQALASYGLLRHFHYLSTVSGGGYIGSWLSAWRFHQRNDEAVFNALAKRSGYPVARDETFAEPAELQQLRANSNFLTPRLGPFRLIPGPASPSTSATSYSTGSFSRRCFSACCSYRMRRSTC